MEDAHLNRLAFGRAFPALAAGALSNSPFHIPEWIPGQRLFRKELRIAVAGVSDPGVDALLDGLPLSAIWKTRFGRALKQSTFARECSTRLSNAPGQGAILWGETAMSTVSTRITIEPGKRGGKPCLRGLRITVWDVLGWLGAGMTEEQILDEHPDLEKADFPAVYQYAAEFGRKANLG